MIKIILTLALVISISAPAFADTWFLKWDDAKTLYPGSTSAAVAGDNAGGVVWSRHNLSGYGPIWQSRVTNLATGALVPTTEICVFCHTPHFARGASAAFGVTGPLWNKTNMAGGYIAYGASIAGDAGVTKVAGTAINPVGGASLACLSCHDGISTWDNMINRPGKGSGIGSAGFDEKLTFSMQGSFSSPMTDHFKTEGSTSTPIEGFQGCLCHGSQESYRLNIGLGDSSSMGDIVGVSEADLSNDHPISITYTVGRASLRPTSTVISSVVMYQARNSNDATYGMAGTYMYTNWGVYNSGGTNGTYGRSDNLWSVNGTISDTATISQLLRDGGQVACASCHDPHYKNGTNNDPQFVQSYSRTNNSYFDSSKTGGNNWANEGNNEGWGAWAERRTRIVTNPEDWFIDGLFLRRVGGNSNSGVCRTCHNK